MSALVRVVVDGGDSFVLIVMKARKVGELMQGLFEITTVVVLVKLEDISFCTTPETLKVAGHQVDRQGRLVIFMEAAESHALSVAIPTNAFDPLLVILAYGQLLEDLFLGYGGSSHDALCLRSE
jgi:hypothetical protein